MPSPTTIAELADLIRKSGVVEDSRLNEYLRQIQSVQPTPTDPRKCAAQMIRDGLLTQFQAENLLAGRWKRFFIGKYKVLERLGHGGMAQVFLCEHKIMKRRVAVKVLPTARAEEASSLERFHREARVVAALDHVNIVRAFDVDQDDQLHFIVMEYVDGVNLQDLVKRIGPLPPLRACHYIRQAALGLQHAFDAAGVLHRDIKPSNLLVDRQGVVKILDMGLARFFHDHEDLLTKQYDETVLGTADYLAPEQAVDSHSVDIRADIYSLGGTFYFLLTGQPPFPQGTVAQKLIWHQTREPKSINAYRNDVAPEIVAIVERMMAKSLDARFRWPREVAEALEPFTATPIPPPAEQEIPRLCPAAQGVPLATSNSGRGSLPSVVIPPRPPAPTVPPVAAGGMPGSSPVAKPVVQPAKVDFSFGGGIKPPPPPPTQSLRNPSADTAPVPTLRQHVLPAGDPLTERPSATHLRANDDTVPTPHPKGRRSWFGLAVLFTLMATLSIVIAAAGAYWLATP